MTRQYKRAEELFHSKNIQGALALLEECAPGDRVTHPYYEYLKACCHAILGSKSKAMNCLRKAVQEWLARLCPTSQPTVISNHCVTMNHLLFSAMVAPAKNLFKMSKPEKTISIETFAPACIVAIGGFIENSPWEGWTTAIADEVINASVQVAQICEPGKVATIAWNNLPNSCSVYCVVKDKRLITTDTPKSRLAASIKDYVTGMSKELAVGTPSKEMRNAYSESVSQFQSASLLDALIASGQGSDLSTERALGMGWGSPRSHRRCANI